MELTCAHCKEEFSANRFRLTCSQQCKNARSRAIAPERSITRTCPGCGEKFTRVCKQARSTCSRECHSRVVSLARGGKGVNREVVECQWCGGSFKLTGWYRKKTCSKRCRAALMGSNAIKPGPCEVCGKTCPHRKRRTCSAQCAAELKAVKARERVSKERNLCVYTPPNEHDRENMIEILTRKGYKKGQASNRYEWEESEGNIRFKDLPPRDLSPEDIAHNREARARKELKTHRNGVEQEAKAKRAHQSPLEKLLSCIEGGSASA